MNTTAYFQSSFNEVNTLDYESINSEVFEEENSTLIFYELKGDAGVDGAKISIDNNRLHFSGNIMIGKLNGRLRIICMNKKIAFEFVMDSGIESIIDKAQDVSLKQ